MEKIYECAALRAASAPLGGSSVEDCEWSTLMRLLSGVNQYFRTFLLSPVRPGFYGYTVCGTNLESEVDMRFEVLSGRFAHGTSTA